MIKYINTNRLNFRKGPGTNYSVIDVLNKFQEIEVIEEGDWSKIICLGREGYVYSKYISNTMYVNTSRLNFREGPSTSHKVIGSIDKNTAIEVIDKDTWFNIIYNNKKGYVHGKYLSDESIEVKYMYVNTSRLNFREGPSMSTKIISTLNENEKVKVLQEGEWIKIRLNNKEGYVYGKYLSDKKSIESIKYKYVNVKRLNFRKGPSTSHDIIRVLNKNDKVKLIKEASWSKIEFNNQVGYVSSIYLDDDKIEEDIKLNDNIELIIAFAKDLLGCPYEWGAIGPNKFDCSGFIKYIFDTSTKINLPRISRDQSKFGEYVTLFDLIRGDLIFFDTDGDGVVNHVGIYLGDDTFIHASSGSNMKVVISTMSKYYLERFTNGRRIKL